MTNLFFYKVCIYVKLLKCIKMSSAFVATQAAFQDNQMKAALWRWMERKDAF
jgi:hypothetical protein